MNKSNLESFYFTLEWQKDRVYTSMETVTRSDRHRKLADYIAIHEHRM